MVEPQYSGTMTVRFECQPGCVACCDQKGFVYLTDADVERIAGFLKITALEFERRYLYRTAHQQRLRKPPDSQCPFLGASGCSVHPVKPVQCQLFPFWPELVEDPAEWRRTATWCPGIGKGPVFQPETARHLSEGMRTAYPRQY